MNIDKTLASFATMPRVESLGWLRVTFDQVVIDLSILEVLYLFFFFPALLSLLNQIIFAVVNMINEEKSWGSFCQLSEINKFLFGPCFQTSTIMTWERDKSMKSDHNDNTKSPSFLKFWVIQLNLAHHFPSRRQTFLQCH